MKDFESYWDDCERQGFVKTQHNGKTIYTLPESRGTGCFEIWGDAATAMVVIMDYTLQKPWTVFEATSERFLQVSQFYSGNVGLYKKRSEVFTAEHGLNCFLNYPAASAYKKVGTGIRILDVGLYYRQTFFENLSWSLPEDFWETTAKVLNPDVVVLPAVTEICNQLLACDLTGNALTIYVQGKLYEAFALLLSYAYAHKEKPPIQLSRADREALESIKDILAANLSSSPSISDLSKMVHMNQQKMMTGFRYLNGMTIYAYLRQLQMKEAAQLLRTTALPISEVAQMVGYCGDGHFQTTFKKIYGISPAKMRKEATLGTRLDEMTK